MFIRDRRVSERSKFLIAKNSNNDSQKIEHIYNHWWSAIHFGTTGSFINYVNSQGEGISEITTLSIKVNFIQSFYQETLSPVSSSGQAALKKPKMYLRSFWMTLRGLRIQKFNP